MGIAHVSAVDRFGRAWPAGERVRGRERVQDQVLRVHQVRERAGRTSGADQGGNIAGT